MKNECDLCGKQTIFGNSRYPKMLVVRDDIWKKIFKLAGEKGWLCPDCMIRLYGRKFGYDELKKNINGAVIPCNLWYIKENGMMDLSRVDIEKETRDDVLDYTGRKVFSLSFFSSSKIPQNSDPSH